MAATRVNGLVWNIKSGGFASYHPKHRTPVRGAAIQDAVKRSGADTVSLIDAHRWDQVYGNNEGIANHLGLNNARFSRLDDDRLNADHGAPIGVLVATNHPIATHKELDLVTRKALSVVLDIGSHGLQIASLYLDDVDWQLRYRQLRALPSELVPDVPTIITGDFNSARPTLDGAPWHVRARQYGVVMASHVMRSKSSKAAMLGDIVSDNAAMLLEVGGYRDAGKPQCLPTWPSRLPMIGVDYVMHNDGVEVADLDVHRLPAASDHCALTYSAVVS